MGHDFYGQAGKMAIGSRLRRLSELITEDAAAIYQLYDTRLQPKWFPVFYILSQEGARTITALATATGHSHPSVSKIVAEMSRADLVIEQKDQQDGRRNLVSLSDKGREIAGKIGDQYIDVGSAVEDILSQTRHNLWKAIEEWEFLLGDKGLLQRVQEQKKIRESREVRIVDYQPQYHAAFKALNEEWITTHFKMEDADHKALDHPQESILDKGGHIFVALIGEEPVGVCALIKMGYDGYDYELAKMAVAPKARGKNVGRLLGQAIIGKARSLGASNLYLESNTLLTPAINLYRKLGFRKVAGHATPYERCNIQMVLDL